MTLAPLASASDLSDRGIDGPAVDTALAVASSLIREAAGSAISSETATVTVTGTRANLLGLPGPIQAVSSVSIDGSAVTDYEVLPNGLWRHCGWSCGSHPSPVTVAYTFGFSIVPADIVDLTCALTKAWLDHNAAGGGSTAGLQSVGVDDARESYTVEASSQLTPVYIPEATRQWLARRFGGSAAVVETL